MEELNPILEKPQGAEKVRSFVGLGLVIVILGLGLVLFKFLGLIAGFALLGLPIGLLVISVLWNKPKYGVWGTIIMGFFAAGIARYVSGPWGLTIDIMLALSWLSVILNKQIKIDWKHAKHGMVTVSLIWFGFITMELINPAGNGPIAWFYAMRGIGFYQALTVPLVFLLFREEKDLQIFLNLIIWFSLIGTIWGFKQQLFGVDGAEHHWLYAENHHEEHILHGKVNIGQFEAGTSIGLVLMADGWDGSKSEDYYHVVFADKTLNPEADEDLKQHNVLLWDEENELFLLGFEDILRDNRPFSCDNDFNDAILFVSSNPVEAISIENVSPIDKPGTLDTDNDGINDILDEYPNDPNKAYDSYYPSSTSFGTFAFEDNWPDYGDYDFNDLVVDYQFKHILNADNQVVQINPTFKIRAIGAGFRNGFGFSMDLSQGDVTSVTGSSLNAGYVKLNGNGTEAGQTNAVVIVSDNVHDHFATGGFVNTQDEDAYFEPVDIGLEIVLNSPRTYEQIGSVPYNPFLIVSGNRGREVHLPGYAPTDKVDSDLFGTLDDDTDVNAGVYYRSKTDLPWAIHLPESFTYPKEKADVRQGHLRFTDWARSSGFSYMDWYRDAQGYRSQSHLYKKE